MTIEEDTRTFNRLRREAKARRASRQSRSKDLLGDLRPRLQAIAGALDDALGDSDHWLDPDYTENELRRDEPLTWATIKLNELLLESPNVSNDVSERSEE